VRGFGKEDVAVTVELEAPFLLVVRLVEWENGEKEREGEEKKEGREE